MDNLDYIENYFTNEPDADRTREFEKKIESDPSFAEEVAFFLSVLKLSREESESGSKRVFREIYQKNKLVTAAPVRNIANRRPARKLIYYIAAAAAVAGIVFGTYILTTGVSPRQLADKYISGHLQTLGVTMSGHGDSLQTGLQMYNEGKPAEALVQFERIIQSDTSNFTAKEKAGLAALRIKDYDKALLWFKELETYSGNYSNPALFYQALTLMERNQSGDDTKAKRLLQQIVQNDLDGKETAQQWLRKW
jgi:tetratricopeptide (TPR) repeat protein